MKKSLILATAIFAVQIAVADNVEISTQNTTLLISADKGKEAQILYYGARLSASDINAVAETSLRHNAYPAYGLDCTQEYALAATHPDGNMTLKLVVEKVSHRSDNGADVTIIETKDTYYPFSVNLCYKTYPDADIIEMYTEISHQEKGVVKLRRYDSGVLPIRRGDVWISHLYGSWANEGRLVEEPITPGEMVISNRDGVRNSHTSHGEIMVSLDGKPRENSGRVIGAAVCYSGNYKIKINTHDWEYHDIFGGINEENSEYNLKKGEVFQTPSFAITYSNEGLSGVSRAFHSWGRNHKLANGNTERKVLLNSWEGVYFDINEPGMDQMMKDIASMGGELFVMDDGWFGVKYPRVTDNCALGDWKVDQNKLPNGIGGLVKAAKSNGVKFGIWIEPEMANTTSELFEQHPDWVVKAGNRDLVLGRGGTQVVLDMSNPKVQDFVFDIVDNLMTNYPEIDYIKWDANMSIMNHGSQYLTSDNQSHLYIEYHRGLEKTCQRIRAKYPKLTIQACASGGGRANWGVLPYFDEFWVSDNTDALQRVYMQWGTSYFFPSIAMASHISAAPNHQTSRTIPLKYRIDVAMSGRLGMEIQPKNMTDEEKDLCRKAIASYKELRPVIQMGDIYRLVSPYDKLGVASMMYVKPDKSKAVFYWWKTETFCNQHLPKVCMAGLDPNRTYTIREINRIDRTPLKFEGKKFSGKFLMEEGLEIPYEHDLDWHKRIDYASRVLVLE